MRQGYASLTVQAVGGAAAVRWWSLSRSLERGAAEAIRGRVAEVFERTLYVELERPEPDVGPPTLVALSTTQLRRGPLLTTLGTPPGFSFVRLGVSQGDRCRLGLTTDDTATSLLLTVGDSLRVLLNTARLPSLPVHRPLPVLDEARFERGALGWSRDRDLLAWVASTSPPGELRWLEALGSHCDTGQDDRVERFVDDLLHPSPDGGDGVTALLGRGPGSTPTGDDILCGTLLTIQCAKEPLRAATGDARARVVSSAVDRTRPLSRALLEGANRGWGAPPVVACLDTLLSGDQSIHTCRDAIRSVREIGHTSGVAILAGILTTTLAVVPAFAAAETEDSGTGDWGSSGDGPPNQPKSDRR